MRPTHSTITRHTVHAYAESVCQKHLRLADHGRKCKAGILWALLFWAAKCFRKRFLTFRASTKSPLRRSRPS